MQNHISIKDNPYNDQFDLHRGDMVYVDGKLEGMLGCVTEVNYNFKIKVSEYNRINYFSAVNKGSLFSFAIDGKETGTIIL